MVQGGGRESDDCGRCDGRLRHARGREQGPGLNARRPLLNDAGRRQRLRSPDRRALPALVAPASTVAEWPCARSLLEPSKAPSRKPVVRIGKQEPRREEKKRGTLPARARYGARAPQCSFVRIRSRATCRLLTRTEASQKKSAATWNATRMPTPMIAGERCTNSWAGGSSAIVPNARCSGARAARRVMRCARSRAAGRAGAQCHHGSRAAAHAWRYTPFGGAVPAAAGAPRARGDEQPGRR